MDNDSQRAVQIVFFCHLLICYEGHYVWLMSFSGASKAAMECREEGLGDLHSLSDEVLCLILERLDERSIGVLSTVSKLLRLFCEEEPLWQSIAIARHKDTSLVWKGTWKRTALFKNVW